MARPKKNTIEYFSHDCTHGKTMFILEQKYGNNGYAFWFKLLELLGSNENHFLHIKTTMDWEFLQAKTHLSQNKCKEILSLLAKLEAIDKELWEESVVWSDNFVKRINAVYKNRRVETPIKPSFYKQKPPQGGVSTGESTQSKVKESKVKESKKNTCVFLGAPAEKSFKNEGAQDESLGKGDLNSNAPAEKSLKKNEGAQSKSKNKSSGKGSYTEEFNKFWAVYPKKIEKKRALRAWEARLKEKHYPKTLILAAKNYAIYCKENTIEARYTKHPGTFLGPDYPFRDFINGIPEPLITNNTTKIPKAYASLEAWAAERNEANDSRRN